MLNVLFITLLMVGTAGQSIAQKNYNAKFKGQGTIFFLSVSALSACLFFLVTSGFKLSFSIALLPYTFAYAVCYAFAAVMGFMAIRTGPLSLTSLIIAYSLIIPTFYGLIFLGDKVGVFFWIGFVLLSGSLFLINSPAANTKITLKWIVFVLLAFLGNGFCALIQTKQQRDFDGALGNEMMIFALFIAAVLVFAVALISDRKSIPELAKRGTHFMVMCGVSNGLANFMLILLLPRMLSAVLFPVISAGQIITSWVVSRFIYKEKLSVKQNVALVLGTAAIVFMNL